MGVRREGGSMGLNDSLSPKRGHLTLTLEV